MRRLIALLVLALVGATLFGLSNTSSGIAVNGTTISNSTFRSELDAISSNATLECYINVLAPASYAKGAGASVAVSGATAWANLRIEGIAIEQYARESLHFHPTQSELANAKTSLLSELTQAGTSAKCAGTSTQAFAAMPSEMQTFEVASQAASLDLVSKLDTTIPLTEANVKAYYDAHVANYDTLCVSIAVVAPTQVAAFTKAQAAGATVAELATQFSADKSSAAHGGAYGCYGPTSSAYSGVRADTQSTALNTFSTTPQYIDYANATYALYVAPTKRTVTPLAQAQNVVASDIESANATGANTEKEKILYYSAVSVDPAYGRWGLTSTGPTLFAPALPAKSDIGGATNVAALSSASSSSYK